MTTLLSITAVSTDLIGSDSDAICTSTLAFLTERTVSCFASIVPEELNSSSATVVDSLWLLLGSLTRVRVLVPDSNDGKLELLGFGIKKLPIKVADLSDINLILPLVAVAPLVSPLNAIPDPTHPKKSPLTCSANDAVSIFRRDEVEE